MTQITATYIDSMGNDLSVVRAAKVSFADDLTVQHFVTDIEAAGVGSKSHEGLIRYLAQHEHWTPFAHTAITLRVSAPVPIRTQCFKHKQGFVENEESRRYIKSTPEVYYPEVWRRAPPEGGAKQGSMDEEVLILKPDQWHMTTSPKTLYRDVVAHCITSYEWLIESGVCPEQARFVLPQGCLVNWYWTGSLAAYARFYQQRTDPHAQKEIQDLAKVIGGIIEPLFPVAWQALTK